MENSVYKIVEEKAALQVLGRGSHLALLECNGECWEQSEMEQESTTPVPGLCPEPSSGVEEQRPPCRSLLAFYLL